MQSPSDAASAQERPFLCQQSALHAPVINCYACTLKNPKVAERYHLADNSRKLQFHPSCLMAESVRKEGVRKIVRTETHVFKVSGQVSTPRTKRG